MCYTPDDDGAAVFRESAMATKTDTQASTKAKAAKSAHVKKPANAQARSRAQRTRLAAVRQLIADVRSEIKKVTWPDRETTRNLTLIVIGLSAILGVLLGGVDALFVRLWDLIHAL
jgi:preprotein translocase subunit SecE